MKHIYKIRRTFWKMIRLILGKLNIKNRFYERAILGSVTYHYDEF